MEIAIHAGKTYDYLGSYELKAKRGIDCYAPHLPLGALVAVARLTQVVTETDDGWFVGPYGWVLDDIQAIDPIPCAGNRGLWHPNKTLQARLADAVDRPFDLDYYLRPPQLKSALFL